jgi:ectoine hydroxylase-related dioxygenase (phytanoyl-CoA dioxygenase family)
LLDDFTDKNGATEVIPGSHRFGRRPVNKNFEDHKGLKKLIASKGSLIIFSGYLWHRSGQNNSTSSRRALLGSFASSAFREISSEEDIVRKSLLNPTFEINADCWELVGGNHGIKTGIDCLN